MLAYPMLLHLKNVGYWISPLDTVHFSLSCAGWGTNPIRLVGYHIKVTEVEDSPCINVQPVDKHVITVAQSGSIFPLGDLGSISRPPFARDVIWPLREISPS